MKTFATYMVFALALLLTACQSVRQADAREYRFSVVTGFPTNNVAFAKPNKVVLSKTVAIGKPFDFCEGQTLARGKLSIEGDQGLHFVGNVSVGSTAVKYDTAVIVAEEYDWNVCVMSGYVQPFFIRFEDIASRNVEAGRAEPRSAVPPLRAVAAP